MSMYFYAELDRPFLSTQVAIQNEVWRAGQRIKGAGALMLLNYETRNNEQVTVKVGLSYTSIENAKKKSALEIGKITHYEDLQNTALESPRYSYKWFIL